MGELFTAVVHSDSECVVPSIAGCKDKIDRDPSTACSIANISGTLQLLIDVVEPGKSVQIFHHSQWNRRQQFNIGSNGAHKEERDNVLTLLYPCVMSHIIGTACL